MAAVRSGWGLLGAFGALLGAGNGSADLLLYSDGLAAGWQNWSWGEHSLTQNTPVHGGSVSIRFRPQFWGGLQFALPSADERALDYATLRLWVHGGSSGGQRMRLYFQLDGLPVASTTLPQAQIVAGQWRELTVDLATIGLGHGGFDTVVIMDDTGAAQNELYLDDLRFVTRTQPVPAGAAVAITIDPAQQRRPIDPAIYGVNFGDQAQAVDLRYPVRRWGGNSTTRYNPAVDVHNTAFDYFFQNIADDNSGGTTSADKFVGNVRAHGGDAVMTVPVIPWIPRDDRVKRWGFSIAKYGPQTSNECAIYNPAPPWCSADAGNGDCNSSNTTGFCVGGKIRGNDPTDTSKPNSPALQTAWVQQLVARFGNASNGGVRYYALDNELMLWNSTHRDVHPAGVTYDQAWARGREYAQAIKTADPAAQVLGPVTWGWCDLFTSAADAAVGPSCIDGADRQAHGGKPFVLWYLEQICADLLSPPLSGRRVDYLDLHYYPQGGVDGLGESGSSELPADAARRFRALRELWDPNWVAESWINDTVRLIPRARAWIAQACPGVKLALTEYKFGPDQGQSGALAQLEVLGILGREGVDLATRWVAPAADSRVENAFRLFLDYDGANSRVAGDSVQAVSSEADAVAAFAIDSPQRLYVVLSNRAEVPRPVTLNIAGLNGGSYATWRFDALNDVAAAGSGTVAGNALALGNLPARSGTLVVISRGSTAGDAIFTNGYE